MRIISIFFCVSETPTSTAQLTMNAATRRSSRMVVRMPAVIRSERAFSSSRTFSKLLTPKVKKGLTLAALLTLVGGVYLTAITKMKQTDDLASLIERETLVVEKAK